MEAFLLKHEIAENKRNARTIAVLSGILALGIIAVVVVPTPQAAQTMRLSGRPRVDSSNDLYTLYLQWKEKYNSMISAEEDEAKFRVFAQNYNWIQKHNSNKNASYSVSLNEFAALTSLEFKTLYCRSHQNSQGILLQETLSINDLPDNVDWRELGAVTPVKSQGNCGADWAFATVGALEGLNFIESNNLVEFSTQQLVDCSEEFNTQGCNGGAVDPAFMYVRQRGLQNSTSYPYIQQEGDCSYNSDDVVFKINKFSDVSPNNNDQLKAAVAQQPVAVTLDAGQSGFQFYSSGVYSDSTCGTSLDHSMLVVGYGVQNNSGYWIIKNSWGASWGENGYILLAREDGIAPGECGVAMAASYPSI